MCPERTYIITLKSFYRASQVLLIGVALERLGDSRADAAYQRAVDLAPDDALVRLNLAGRHARAGRLNVAVQEADITAELLRRLERPDPQVCTFIVRIRNCSLYMKPTGSALVYKA